MLEATSLIFACIGAVFVAIPLYFAFLAATERKLRAFAEKIRDAADPHGFQEKYSVAIIDLEARQKAVELEWANAFQKLTSIAGRVDKKTALLENPPKKDATGDLDDGSKFESRQEWREAILAKANRQREAG